MSPTSKKLKLEEHKTQDKKLEGNSFSNIHVFILSAGIGPKRLEIMKRSASKNGFIVHNQFESSVTHILSELPFKNQVKDHIRKQNDTISNWDGPILDTKWLTESIKSGGLVSELAYALPAKLTVEEETVKSQKKDESNEFPSDFDLEKFNSCVPERRAILGHLNQNIAVALDLLNQYWELCHQTTTDSHRALAFARAAAAVKCLPFQITNANQLKGIKDLGEGHALRVATEIVETGHSPEVEEKRNDPKYRAFKELCSIYGVGPSMAKKWFSMGIRNVEDVKKRFDELDINNEMVTVGLAFSKDLNQPLLLPEGQKIYDFVVQIATSIMPEVVISMNGGFRRGKSNGHDLDILFGYAEREDENYSLLSSIKDELDRRGLLIWSRIGGSDGPKGTDLDPSSATGKPNDPLLLYMLIMKYPPDGQFDSYKEPNRQSEGKPFELAASQRDWRAVRVDLVGATRSQYAFAQLGWTGNKQYNRCLRQYAKDIGFSLSSTGMYDIRQRRWVPAQTERDIFQQLKLTYREPWERNF